MSPVKEAETNRETHKRGNTKNLLWNPPDLEVWAYIQCKKERKESTRKVNSLVGGNKFPLRKKKNKNRTKFAHGKAG